MPVSRPRTSTSCRRRPIRRPWSADRSTAIAAMSTNQGVMLKPRGVDIYALNAQELGLPETTGTIYAREDFLAANRTWSSRFLKGAVEAWRWALANPEPTTKLMVEKYGAPGLNYSGAADRDQREQALHRVRAGVGQGPAGDRSSALSEDHRDLPQGRHGQDRHDGAGPLRLELHRCGTGRPEILIDSGAGPCRGTSRSIRSPWSFTAVANR